MPRRVALILRTLLLIAWVLSKPPADAHNSRLDLIGRPEAPLIGARVILHIGWPHWRTGVLFREVKINRERFPEDEAIILKGRNVSVGVDAQVIRRPALRIWPDRYVLVGNAQLLKHPQRAA